MPRVCYIRPNRSKVRHFTINDARRILSHMLDEQYSNKQILAMAIIVTDSVDHLELLYRRTMIVRTLARVMVSLFIFSQFNAIWTSMRAIATEIGQRLALEPLLAYKSISLWAPISSILMALLRVLGGFMTVMKFFLSWDSEWLADLRLEVYNQLQAIVPDDPTEADEIAADLELLDKTFGG